MTASRAAQRYPPAATPTPTLSGEYAAKRIALQQQAAVPSMPSFEPPQHLQVGTGRHESTSEWTVLSAQSSTLSP